MITTYNKHMQVYNTAGVSMCHWILRSRLWTHCSRQQHQWGNTKEHLWLLLCTCTTVSLGAYAAVASHHAWGLLSWSPLWCTGEHVSVWLFVCVCITNAVCINSCHAICDYSADTVVISHPAWSCCLGPPCGIVVGLPLCAVCACVHHCDL